MAKIYKSEAMAAVIKSRSGIIARAPPLMRRESVTCRGRSLHGLIVGWCPFAGGRSLGASCESGAVRGN